MEPSSLEAQILLNQIAQDVRPLQDAEKLMSDDSWSEVIWNSLMWMVCQAHPTRVDVEEGIEASGLKSTYTPCVLLLKEQGQFQIQKIISLPKNEWNKSLSLLVSVFGVSGGKRRIQCGVQCNHGWHEDFGDESVLSEIRERGHI